MTPGVHEHGSRFLRRLRVLLLAAVVTGMPAALRADVLVVTRDGQGIRSTSARKDGNQVRYLDRETGEEKSIPVDSLDGVVNMVQRGKPYPAEDIHKQIEKIQKLKAKHQRLLRPLNEILQGWEALLRPSPEFENQITNLVAQFEASDKGPKIYSRVTLDLGMIKFKDVQGLYTAKVDSASAAVRSEFVAVNARRLEKMAASDKLGAADFIAMKRLATPVIEASESADKERVRAMVEKTRNRVYAMSLKLAETGFSAAKSLSAYLQASALLQLLKKEVAATDAERSQVEGRLEALQGQAGRVLPAWDFAYHGFPMTPEDRQLYNRVKNWSSRVTFADTPVDEQCFLMPTQPPGTVRVGQPFTIPMRLVFNAAQPTNRVFGMTLVIPTAQAFETRTTRLPALELRDGRASLTYREDFEGMDPGVKIASDSRAGGTFVYCYLVALNEDSDPANPLWDALSAACRLPAQP